MKNTFTVELDGQMARIIVASLLRQGLKEKGLTQDYHYMTAQLIDNARESFHSEAHDVLTRLYGVGAEIAATIEEGVTK